MGIWILYFVINLILPILMLSFGYGFNKHPVQKINKHFGYRSKRANSSQEAWNFAQILFAKLWIRFGYVFLAFSCFLMLVVLGQKKETVTLFSVIICITECIAIFIPTYVVEKALQKKFKK